MMRPSFGWMCGICLGSIFPALIALIWLPGSCAPGSWWLNSCSSIVHDINQWSFSQAPSHRTVLFGAGISTVSSLEKFYVMMWSSVALLISSSDAPPIRSLHVCASDSISDAPVLWIISWNWLSTFSKWDFVELEYSVRDVAAFKSPPMILCRTSDFFISAWMWVLTRLWRSGRVAVAWWMLIMLICSPSCVIASCHRTRPWAMCSSAFLSRGLC